MNIYYDKRIIMNYVDNQVKVLQLNNSSEEKEKNPNFTSVYVFHFLSLKFICLKFFCTIRSTYCTYFIFRNFQVIVRANVPSLLSN